MSSMEASHRASMAISHLLNPVNITPSKNRHLQDKTDQRTNSQTDTERIAPDPQTQQSHLPIFEIPTVPAQKQSKRPRNAEDFARYPLLAALISSKLVEHVKFQTPYPTSETLSLFVKETYERIFCALCDLNCPTPVVLSALLYVLRIFPEGIPHRATLQGRHCVNMLTRLFLLGFQLSIIWFHDNYVDLDNWTSLMGMTKRQVIRFQQEALQVLNYTLFISPMAWNAFVEQIHEDCPSFLNAGDVENLRRLVKALHVPICDDPNSPLSPEKADFAKIAVANSELAVHRARIVACALRGKILSSTTWHAASRIEPGTEADYIFDMADQEEELLFEELQENHQLYPPLPQSRSQSPTLTDSLKPTTFSNTLATVDNTSQETFAPPFHSTPQSVSHSSCLSESPASKIEEAEPKLIWSSPSSMEDMLAECQENPHSARREQSDPPSFSIESAKVKSGQHNGKSVSIPSSVRVTEGDLRAQREPLRQLDPFYVSSRAQSGRYGVEPKSIAVTEGTSKFSSFQAELSPAQCFAQSPSVYRYISQGVMDMTLELKVDTNSASLAEVPYNLESEIDSAKPQSLKQDRFTGEQEKPDPPRSSQSNLGSPSESPAASEMSFQDQDENPAPLVSQTPPVRSWSTIDSSLFCLSPLTPLPSEYMTDSESEVEDDGHEAGKGNSWKDYIDRQSAAQAKSGPHAQGENEDEDDDSEDEYDWDTDSESSEYFDLCSASPPPFRVPDTYNKETGEWVMETSARERRREEEEEEPFDPVTYFTSMACTSDVEDESCYPPYEAPRWQVEPMSLGQGGFTDEDRPPSPHAIDLEAHLILREFASIRAGRNQLAPSPSLSPLGVHVDRILRSALS
ncbi:hypothetical protein DFH05DRAFT_474186 [Lentinula detonsa]|uniref:Uncharacterized protein n=1 Tax=Lentinula detonsa TaxID=2804962 RepID=A0A9W8NSG9_9AGAR|nr:hypothetical protein DFH05DRAFT_474186 [Lentinula detonsa]